MEGEEHLNLRWNDHIFTFVHLLNHYRLEEQYCDARLACAGGGVYPVHKVVLSACSDFFATIFASDSCQNPVVVLQDVATEHLEALLTYVYRGEVLLARSDLPAFLKVAESLQVKGLAPPPLLPLPRDTWESSGASHDKHPGMHSHPPPQYPPSDPVNSSPVGVWGDGVQGNDAPLHAHKAPGGHDGVSTRPHRKRLSPHFVYSEQFGGSFRNLVASEEGDIKEEPEEEEEEESTDYLDSGALRICEEEGEEVEMQDELMKEEHDEPSKERESEKRPEGDGEEKHNGEQQDKMEEGEEEEEERRKDEGRQEEGNGELQVEEKLLDSRHPEIMNMTSITTTPSPSLSLSIHSPTSNLSYSSLTPSPSLSTHSPTPGHHARSPTQPLPLSPTPAPTPHSPVQATPPSQLRQELLKPLYRIPHNPHLAIPHPVIASRDGEAGGEVREVSEVPRDPPPLVKISSVSPVSSHQLPFQYHHHHHHRRHHHHHQHHHHHHPHLHSRQSDGREDNTHSTHITAIPTTTTNKTHHLLVTTQPTYQARLPPPPPSTTVPPSSYHTLPCQYKNLQIMDTEAPLNLSQDTQQRQNRTQHPHGTHRHRASHHERQRDGDPFLGKILTNRKRRLRGPKSWEYLVRLLRDPSTNPSLIRWENESRGVFRLVQPAAIAQRWGRRTGKHASECLTYENFARGLRYHYATGALEPVSERSFVYKFGPKAHLALGDGDWRVSTGEATETSASVVETRT